MTDLPTKCVIDASTGIKLVLPEDGSGAIQRLLDESPDIGDSFFIPDLFFAECGSVLWKRVRRAEITASVARKGMDDLLALHLSATPIQALAARAVTIALEREVTVYDACYVALAEAKSVPLLTADRRLAERLGKGLCEVTLLHSGGG